jgi:hypothetical protein
VSVTNGKKRTATAPGSMVEDGRHAEQAVLAAGRALDRARAVAEIIEAVVMDPDADLTLTTYRPWGRVRVPLFSVNRRAYPEQTKALLRFARRLQSAEVDLCLQALEKARARVLSLAERFPNERSS